MQMSPRPQNDVSLTRCTLGSHSHGGEKRQPFPTELP